MAGGKESPRQKMIGMMYLVLTALLALNVSKDILRAFVVINEDIELSIKSTQAKADLLYADFNAARALDTTKTQHHWEKAQQAKALSDSMLIYINELKKELIAETEGIPMEAADTIQLKYVEKQDDYTKPTEIMIGSTEDGANGKARKLKLKIEAFKANLLNLLDKEDSASTKIGLNTNIDYHSDGKKINWEIQNFHYTSLAAAVTMLSKLEKDVKLAEVEVVNKLFKKINAMDFKFDTIMAKVTTPSNYVLLGEEYKAEVFLAAYNTTQNPNILAGVLDSSFQLKSVQDTVPVSDGTGKYVQKATKEGIHEFQGIINMKSPDGSIKPFPFRTEYMVAKPSLVVSPDKMNVVYKGIANPISISVPGIPAENIIAKLSNGDPLRKIGNGKYEAKISPNARSPIYVDVSAKMPSGTIKVIGRKQFRSKRLPKPYAKIGTITITGKMRKSILANQFVLVEYSPDFAFALSAKITSFRMWVTYRGEPLEFKSRSGRFTEEMKTAIKNLKRGTKVEFSSIRAKGSDGIEHELSPIIIEVF